jgi:uncharacterized repeat protein (TIGR03803 family)
MKGYGIALAFVLACLFSCSFARSGSAATLPQLSTLKTQNTAGARAVPRRVHPNPSCNPYDSFFSFNGTNGSEPEGSLIQLNDADGTLYGTTSFGGTYGAGTVFSISVVTPEKVLHSFNPGEPMAGLIDVDGEFYGTASQGGKYGAGYVFQISTSGSKSDLYDFKGGSDGAGPAASLIYANGALFGTTGGGGKYSGGTVFKVTPSGSETLLHSFGSGADGADPIAPLIAVGNGLLYGTTAAGGAYDGGTVFEINPSSSQESVLHSFSANSSPNAGLIYVNGELYGTASGRAAFGFSAYPNGFVFKVGLSGGESHVYNFKGGNDGIGPYAPLIDVNGTLYGTTLYGGAYSRGTLFALSTSGQESVLHSFGSGSDGAGPYNAGLILGTGFLNSVLWGATLGGGTSGNGTIFYYALGCSVI